MNPESLIAQAQDKLSSFWSRFDREGARIEANELYTKAANVYKSQCQWLNAAMAYKLAGEYAAAGSCYKNVDTKQMIAMYEIEIERLKELGKFSRVAKLQEEIAEAHRKNYDTQAAADYYLKASVNYDLDNMTVRADECKELFADAATTSSVASHGRMSYSEAAATYERIVDRVVENSLVRYSAGRLLLKAGLCRVLADEKFDYDNAYPMFSNARESKFLTDVADAVVHRDIERFQAVIYEYDLISKIGGRVADLLDAIRQLMIVSAEQIEDSDDLRRLLV